MADFAPNVTSRYRLNYSVATRPHSVMVRGARGTSFAAMEAIGISFFFGLFTAYATIMFDDLAFVSAAVALTDSDLFFPAGVPAAVVGGIAIATASKQDTITHLTHSGRGSLGSKVSFHLYGVATNPDLLPANVWSDFVATGLELAQVSTAVALLNNPATDIVAVDNTKPVFGNRATVKVNDFWLRTVRAGG